MRKVADPPDVIAAAVFFDVPAAEFVASGVLAARDGFEHGTIAVAASANVVDLSGTRVLEKFVQSTNEVGAVDVVPDLFFLLAKNRVRSFCYGPFHQVRQKTM